MLKLKHSRKMFIKNQRGFAHHLLLPLFVIAVVTVIGAYVITHSHAATISTPIVYTNDSYNNTTNVNTTSIGSIFADGTGKTPITSTSSSSGRWATNAIYSPNHKYIAWTEQTNGIPTGVVKIKDTSTGLIKTYQMNSNEINNFNKIVWYPDSTKLIYPGWNSTNNVSTLRQFTVSTGAKKGLTDISHHDGQTTADINSYAVLDDGQTIVYTDSAALKVLMPGQTTPVTKRTFSGTNYCSTVSNLPHVATGFVYACWINSSSRIYQQTTTTAAVKIYSTPVSVWANGAKNSYIDDRFAVSKGGGKLSFYLSDQTVDDIDQCLSTDTTSLATINLSGSGLKRIAVVKPTKQSSGCKGGGYSNNTIAWSPDGTQIAYIVPSTDPSHGAAKVVSTTSPYTVVSLKQNASNLSW